MRLTPTVAQDPIWGGLGLRWGAESRRQILPRGCLPCVPQLEGAGSVAEERDGTPGLIWSSPRSKPAGRQASSELVLAMESKPGRKSRSCLPLPGHKHFGLFFFRQQQRGLADSSP